MRFIAFVAVMTIFILGVVMIYNTSSAEILDRFLDQSLYASMLKQLLYACIGAIGGYTIIRLGYRKLLQWSPYILGLCIIALIALWIPHIGQKIHGACRWIRVGPLTFQPSEFVKWALLLYGVFALEKPYDQKGYIRLACILLCPVILILLQPDHGSVAVIVMMLCALFFMTGIKMRYWVVPISIFLVVGGMVAYQIPYVKGRIAVYLHPDRDLLGKGHQPYQAKIAVGSGGLLGRGYGNSIQKLTYLPEAQNDYIAAIYGEETGFIGICGLIFLYMLFGYYGFYTATQTKDPQAIQLATLMTLLILVQAFFNLGVVSGLLPSKGVNLPFFSQGGSSLVMNILSFSVVWDIAAREA